ncbi:MAG: hypothetical protein ABUL60_14070, partial [Myxococcales bacterium]
LPPRLRNADRLRSLRYQIGERIVLSKLSGGSDQLQSNDAVLTVEDVHFEKITLDGEPLELPTIKQFPFNVGLKPGRYSFLTSCNKKTPIVLDVTPKHEYTLGDALSGGPRIVDAGAGKMLAIVDFECVLMDQTTQATIVRMPAELRDEAPAPQAPASNQPPTSPPP